MVTPEIFLQELGLSEKERRVYMTLLRRGPSSVRQLAESSEVNRGTTYDILKSLQEQGVVSFFDKDKKTMFVAESPETLQEILENKKRHLKTLEQQLSTVLPQLSSIAALSPSAKPVARYYHGSKAIKSILLEVLHDVGQLEKKEYIVYSSSAIAQHLYDAIPDYTKKRIKADITVRVIAFGPGGNGDDELSERRWLSRETSAPTYTIIFGRKTAFISLDEKEQPHGVILEDLNLANTQRMLFESTWSTLKS